ncbi:hypothetical protein GCM10025886_14710 [Tetragenococcus halophilus subsp. flandriensis]|uniref:nuclear transport factor 2 family protein n=1 Tax=Tetragenococcus halophilus TaxID=51669 RepID=UPI0023E9C4AC|nr:nuclear transport factor 2 family protein [Tetragenococcus halophilus]GMA08320.1 hypothetical protein GCM10025886_14710 [Tetragenococcus halophilus subsp. flandriensis]
MELTVMQEKIGTFFKKYEQEFNRALKREVDLETITGFYTEEFIAANPMGVKTGENNDELKEAMTKGYDYYRSIGTKKMACEDVQVTRLDNRHAIAHTRWRSFYEKEEKLIEIPFESHYLIQFRKENPLVFGWITGDESQLLKENGII